MLRDLLWSEGQWIKCKRVRTVMARMGIDALSYKPNVTSDIGARVYPNLLRHQEPPDATRSGRLANILTTDYCIEMVHKALAR